ncbi:hypothetical protein L6452_03126 [Arctium lappa]|uniref:Uncharacterized protein n=1 Tax=Arctium lappa TaxID=4217 RepID=A0ACB9FKT7_ARCLA|nr:hypothetical protein L6452_03126 [Arctium lappa]
MKLPRRWYRFKPENSDHIATHPRNADNLCKIIPQTVVQNASLASFAKRYSSHPSISSLSIKFQFETLFANEIPTGFSPFLHHLFPN